MFYLNNYFFYFRKIIFFQEKCFLLIAKIFVPKSDLPGTATIFSRIPMFFFLEKILINVLAGIG